MKQHGNTERASLYPVCHAVSPDGRKCLFMLGHSGSHDDGSGDRGCTWTREDAVFGSDWARHVANGLRAMPPDKPQIVPCRRAWLWSRTRLGRRLEVQLGSFYLMLQLQRRRTK